MGQYLITGIVYRICLGRDRGEKHLPQVMTELNNVINLNKYTYSETKHYYLWEIKEEHLIEDLVPFLKEQYMMYDSSVKHTQVIEALSLLQTGKEVKEYVEQCKSQEYTFILDKELLDYVDVGGFGRFAEVRYELIRIFLDGKILMECYNNIFRYITKAIQLQKEKYRIADCVRVMITS